MQLFSMDFVGYTPSQIPFIVDGNDGLSVITAVDGVFLHKIPGSVRASAPPTSFNVISDVPGSTYVFVIIDGRTCFLSSVSGVWEPIPVGTDPALLPSLGLSAASQEGFLDSLAIIFLDEKPHVLGFALALEVLLGVAPSVLLINITVPCDPKVDEVSFTRVYGTFPVGHGIYVPSSFLVELSQNVAYYKGNPFALSAHRVLVDQVTGEWEVYLPDTDSMVDRGATYSFFFYPARRLVRKIPKTTEVLFGDLPLGNEYS